MMNFHVEKKVPNFFIDWNASVSKTKMQKLEWLFFLDKNNDVNLSDDVVFVGRRRICRTTSYSSSLDFLSKKPSGFSFE